MLMALVSLTFSVRMVPCIMYVIYLGGPGGTFLDGDLRSVLIMSRDIL